MSDESGAFSVLLARMSSSAAAKRPVLAGTDGKTNSRYRAMGERPATKSANWGQKGSRTAQLRGHVVCTRADLWQDFALPGVTELPEERGEDLFAGGGRIVVEHDRFDAPATELGRAASIRVGRQDRPAGPCQLSQPFAKQCQHLAQIAVVQAVAEQHRFAGE